MSRLLLYVMLPVLIACVLIASRFVSWDSLKGEDPKSTSVRRQRDRTPRGTNRPW